MYQDKLAHLKKQLYQLEEASHPEYLRRLKKVEQVFFCGLIIEVEQGT